MAKKIELLHTTYDESGNIESQEVVHPLTSPDCIIMENGKTLDEVMGDGIATPTLTHEGTSFKVGVGDSNIEVVDGDVAGMTLKGQSYQNILPKPTTLIMETDEQEFKINDKIDSNIIIDDNIAEIATVKGKTIVNAVQEESGSEYTVLGEDLSGQSIVHVKDVPTLDGSTLVNLILGKSVENSHYTDYTIPEIDKTKTFFIKFNSTKNIAQVGFIVNDTTWNVSKGEGLNILDGYVILKPNENLNVTKLRVVTNKSTGSYVLKTMLFEYQEGMENWDIPYFEGIKTFEDNIKGITLQGQTLVNTIQEPCEDKYVVLGAEDGIEIGAETGGHGTIENTVQGGINGAVLEGNTLVNLAQTKFGTSGSSVNIIRTDIENGMTYTLPSEPSGYITIRTYAHKLLKPSTTYTILFEIVKNTIPDYNGVTVSGTNDSYFGRGEKQLYLNDTFDLSVGKKRLVVTTHNDISTYDGFGFGFPGFPRSGKENSGELTIKNVMIIEGDYSNEDIPYFEGMKSVQMPVLKTVGKNLNTGTLVLGKIEDNGEVNEWVSSMCYNPDYIEVMSNTEYSIKWIQEVNNMRVFFYDCKRQFIVKSDLIPPSGSTFITPSNCKYIRFHLGVAHDGWQNYKIAINKGNTIPTSCEPYQSSTVTTPKMQLTEAMFEQGSVDEKRAVGTLYADMKNTSESDYYQTRIRTATTYKVKPNTDYQLKLNNNYRSFIVCFNNGKYMSFITWNTKGTRNFTVPSNCNEIALVFCFVSGASIPVSEFPNMGVELAEISMLRGIGDVKDELDLTTGKLTQRIGEVVFDGSIDEDWVFNNTENTTTNRFIITIPKSKVTNDEKGRQSYLCDKLQQGLWSDTRTIGITIIDNAVFLYNKDIDYSINALRNWLQSNPITIQYPLATESVKTIDLQVTDQDGNTIPHIQTQPTVTHITASSDYLIPTVTIDNNLSYKTIIKPSTLYTVRFKHDTVNADNPLTVDLGGTVQTVTSTEFTITTPSELTHNQLVFSGKNNVVSEVQVIEGNVVGTQYPFFEGMNDVQITDMTRNVNLFDINDTVSGYLGGTGTEIKVPDHGNLTSNYIKVKPNTTYVYNHGGFVSNFADYWTGMYFYQDDKGTESNLYTNGSFNRFVHTGQGKKYSNFKFTTPADCEYIRIGSRGLSYDGAWATLYQLDNFDDGKFIARSKNIWKWGNLLNVGVAEITVNLEPGEYWFSCNSSIPYDSRPVIVFFDENLAQITYGFADASSYYKLPTKTRMIYLYSNGYSYQNSKTNLTSFTNIMLTKEPHVKADYEPYKGVVEVQQDVDSIPLTSDMFEQNGWQYSGMINGMTIQQFPTFDSEKRIRSKSMIKVKPNTTYTLNSVDNFNDGSDGGWIVEFDKNGLYIGVRIDDITTFTTRHNAEYIAFVLLYLESSNREISPSALDSMNLILQEVPQEIVLRGISDVKDELDLTRGEYIQRIGEAVFDGSSDENWVIVTSTTSVNEETTLIGIYGLNDAKPENTTDATAVANNMVTNNYVIKNIFGARHTTEGCTLHIDNGLNRGHLMVRTKMLLTNAQQWEDYLQTNPLVVQYELATPIIHKVNLTNTKVIPSYATETHYKTITPSNSLIPNITIPSTLNYDVAIKPSTEYTIRANTSDNLTVDLGGTIGTLSNGKVTLTTPATLTHNEVKFSGTGKVKELMVVEGNEIKDNVPFFNGMKDVEMGGIKLVNIARGATCNNLVTANTNKTQFTYTSDGTNWGDVLFDKSLLKQNTLYTIYINVISSNSDNANPLKISMGDDLNTWLNISSTGLFKQTFATNDNIENLFGINFRPCTSGQKVVIKNPMVIEGDWTHLDEIPYIESEMIIDQPIIRSQGKNLLDLESKPFTVASAGTTFTKSGNTYTVTTTLANSTPYDYIRRVWTVNDDKWLKDVAGKKLTLSVSSISCTNSNSMACIQLRIECMDGTKYYPGIHNGGKAVTFNMPVNVKDLQMQIMTNNTGAILTEDAVLTISNIRLELGDTATPYEPYKHQTLYSNRVIGYEENCYYIASNGNKVTTNSNLNSVKADVEGLSIAYISKTSSNYVFWDKDGVFISGKATLDTAGGLTDKDGFIVVPSNAKYLTMAVSNKDTNRLYTDTTVTGELPLRSLPNGVCDTLNLVTSEYVQKVGEVVLDGSQKDEYWLYNEINQTFRIQVIDAIQLKDSLSDPLRNKILVSSDKLASRTYSEDWNSGTFISLALGARIVLRIEGITTTSELTKYLKQNPITVQYELGTPIVRKLGFTTKGNYAEILLTGGEDLYVDGNINNADTARFEVKVLRTGNTVYYDPSLATVWFDNLDSGVANTLSRGQVSAWSGDSVMFALNKYNTNVTNLQEFTQWLGLNSSTLGFLTKDQSSESYSNIHKPIFFNNVNVQFLPYNLDIQPQLTLQARTRNSYVMDMMKANTKYTMKCLSYSDGARLWLSNGTANVSVATNKSFSFAQSSLDNANKQLVIVGQWYEPMIIEGDVTGKNLPYFKGILSSYHDVDEIEIYSVNKNLFDMSKVEPYNESGAHWWNTTIKENEVVSVRSGNIEAGQFGAYATLDVRPNSVYTLYIEMEKDGEPFGGQIYVYENDKVWGNGTFSGHANAMYHLRTSQNAQYITIGLNYGKDFPIGTTFVSKNMRLYLGEESPIYIPHAHNTTLIKMPTRLETVKVVRPVLEKGGIENNGQNSSTYLDGVRTRDLIPVKPNMLVSISNNGVNQMANWWLYDINKNCIKKIQHDNSFDSSTLTIPENTYFVRIHRTQSNIDNLIFTLKAYKPIQLNSLPNGVYDEIIMKPNSNKAQLVQRVGKVVLDGSEDWSWHEVWSAGDIVCAYTYVGDKQVSSFAYSDKFEGLKAIDALYPQNTEAGVAVKECIRYNAGTAVVYVFIKKARLGEYNYNGVKEYLKDNPLTVYYQCNPVTHEIQLKGYPHAYENGTVTLNTDVPHQTLASYNVNQEQLIHTQNETIIRHDQQIDDLYYYIEMYLEEIYQMELFRMKLELSL